MYTSEQNTYLLTVFRYSDAQSIIILPCFMHILASWIRVSLVQSKKSRLVSHVSLSESSTGDGDPSIYSHLGRLGTWHCVMRPDFKVLKGCNGAWIELRISWIYLQPLSACFNRNNRHHRGQRLSIWNANEQRIYWARSSPAQICTVVGLWGRIYIYIQWIAGTHHYLYNNINGSLENSWLFSCTLLSPSVQTEYTLQSPVAFAGFGPT